MSDRTFALKYGKQEFSFTVPEDQLICEILGKEYQAIEDLAGAVTQAMRFPIDSPPMREIVRPGEKVVVTVSDITRAWQRMDLILPLILNELNGAGVPDENITVLIVVGGHRLNTEAEFKQLCSEEVCRRVKVMNHDAWDEENMVYYGKTSRGTEVSLNRVVAEADRLIMTGGIIYHYMVGYGGGRKSIMPGCASIKTIRQSHLWALGPNLGDGSNPTSMSGMLRGGECHEDMVEVAAFAKPDFIINLVPTPEGKLAAFFAGNWMTAWEAGTKLVDEIYGVAIPAKADIVVTTAGGYPKDINMYQTGKTMDNACYAVKKGGVVVLLSECPDIAEPEEFSQWFQYDTKRDMEAALRAGFTIPGWVALKEIECSDIATFIMVTKEENFDFVRKVGLTPVASLDEALAKAKEICPVEKPQYIVMPQGANTVPLFNGKPQIG